MEISVKQQDELYPQVKKGHAAVTFTILVFCFMEVLWCLMHVIEDGSYVKPGWVVGLIVGALAFGSFCLHDITATPKLNPEYLEFADLKVNGQYIKGKVTKVEFSLDSSRPDMCRIHVTGDDGLSYSTVAWLELNNLLSKDLANLKEADGRLEITDPEKIALVGRECCIYEGKKNKYLEVYTGDMLTRAVLRSEIVLC